MIALAAAWILSLPLEYGGRPQSAPFATEQECVSTGEKLHQQARRRARREGRPPPSGWICVPDDAKGKQ